MGGRKFRLSVRKYNEKKEPLSLIVTIELTKDLTVLKVSLPRELYCPVETLSTLKAQLTSQPLPPQWFFSPSGASICLFKIQHQESAVEISFSVSIDEHLQWSVTIGDRTLSPVNSPTLASVPSILGGISHVLQLFTFLDSCRPCTGNSEQKFMDVARHRESIQQGIGMTRLYTVHLL